MFKQQLEKKILIDSTFHFWLSFTVAVAISISVGGVDDVAFLFHNSCPFATFIKTVSIFLFFFKTSNILHVYMLYGKVEKLPEKYLILKQNNGQMCGREKSTWFHVPFSSFIISNSDQCMGLSGIFLTFLLALSLVSNVYAWFIWTAVVNLLSFLLLGKWRQKRNFFILLFFTQMPQFFASLWTRALEMGNHFSFVFFLFVEFNCSCMNTFMWAICHYIISVT